MLRKCLLLLYVVFFIGCGMGGGGGSEATPAGQPTQPQEEKLFKVVSVSPADNAADVAVNAAITLTLNEAIDLASEKDMNFTVVQNTLTGGKVTLTETTVGLTPDKDFQGLSTVVVKLSGLKSKTGKTMAPFTSSFTTGKEPDKTPPTIVDVSPLTGAVVGVDTTVTATFNEPIDPLSLNANTFLVEVSATHTAVTGALTLDSAGTKATFTPSANLAFSTLYGVKIVGVKDLSGNATTTTAG